MGLALEFGKRPLKRPKRKREEDFKISLRDLGNDG
jgi:hypothetical protein